MIQCGQHPEFVNAIFLIAILKKEHEKAEKKNTKPVYLGCSWVECNEEFSKELNNLADPIKITEKEMVHAVESYKIVGIDKAMAPSNTYEIWNYGELIEKDGVTIYNGPKQLNERSVFEIEIWNKAIEAAALIADDNDEITAIDIRKLKR